MRCHNCQPTQQLLRCCVGEKAFFLSFCLLIMAAISLVFSPPVLSASEDSSTEPESTAAEPLDIEYPEWFKTSFMELEEDILEARQSGKRLMLVFHQPGCPYCNAFVERNLAQKDIETSVKTNFDVIEINMWGDLEVIDVNGTEFTEKTFASHLKVQFTPTVLMYDQSGSIALRINGYYPPDKFRAALDYVLDENHKTQSFNDYLATLSSADVSASPVKNPASQPYILADDFSTGDDITLPGKDNNKPYILLFEQKDCRNCSQLHDTVLSEQKTQSYMDQFDTLRIDMWGKDKIIDQHGNETSGRELAGMLDVSYAPTMVMYSADHQEVIRSESWLKQFHTQSMMDYVLSDAWQEQPSFQIYLRERADKIRNNGEVVDILK